MPLIIILMSVLAADPISGRDCGAELYKSEIAMTRQYIVNEAPMQIPRQQFAAKVKSVCVRMSFDIDVEGRSVNIRVEQSSGSRSFDQAAVLSLKRFVFVKGIANHCRIGHLVIISGSKP